MARRSKVLRLASKSCTLVIFTCLMCRVAVTSPGAAASTSDPRPVTQALPSLQRAQKEQASYSDISQDFNLEHAGDNVNEVPGDSTSPPMLCYVGAYKYTEDVVTVDTTDGLDSYMASRTADGEPNVCASYRQRSHSSGSWYWHYRVMTSSTCSSLAAVAAVGSDGGGNVTHVTCCSEPYCNRPDSELDTAAVATIPRTRQELSCYDVQYVTIGETAYAVPVTYTSRGLQRHQFPPPPGAYKDALDVVCMTQYTRCNVSGWSPGEFWGQCSDEEMLSGAERWRYSMQSADYCNWISAVYARASTSRGPFQSAACCDIPYCNKPDPVRDTAVIAVGTPEETPASLTCYVNVDDPPQLISDSATPKPPAAFSVELPSAHSTMEEGKDPWHGFTLSYLKSQPAVCASFMYRPCVTSMGWQTSRWSPGNYYRGLCEQHEGQELKAWAYRRVPLAECLEMQQHGMSSNELNVTCCSTPGCNAPDPQHDPNTRRFLAETLPLADNITCYKGMQLGETISGDMPPAVYPVTLEAQRIPVPDESSREPSYAIDPIVCYSAQLDLCASGIRDCTSDEAAAGIWVWEYDAKPLSSCYQQQWASSVGDLHLQSVSCCGSDLCNTPDRAVDNTTQVFDVAAPAFPTISCFTSTNATAQGLPAVRSLKYNSTVTTWRPTNHSRMGNGTFFNATSNTTQYFSVNETAGWNGTWNGTWNSTWNSSINSTWNGSDVIVEPFVCASYKLELCTPGSSECEGYDNIPGVSSWAYYPLTLSQCYQMHWMMQQPGSQFKGVTCCSTDNCNAPDPTLDNATQIVGPTSEILNSQQCRAGAHISSSNVLGAAVNWSLAVWEATPFPGTRAAFVKVTADLDPAWEQQQQQLGQRYMAWEHAVLPLQPALHEPPAGYGIPAPFSVKALGGGHCEVSAVPDLLFGGTVEFYVHIEYAGNGDAWLEVWGRAHDDIDTAAAAALFGPSGWSRNVVKFINMLDRKKLK